LRRIAFINEKGGTGKTTLAVNVAAWLATARKSRVLLADLDTQGHAGKSLGVDVRGLRPNVADLLVDPAVHVNDVVVQTGVEGLDLLPANKDLADFPERIAGAPDRERRLSAKLADLAGYDYLVIDAPPSMGVTTLNVMLAAEEIVIPVALTYFALDGCAEILETVGRVREAHPGARPEVSLVVPTLYRRTSLADAILDKLRERFPSTVAKTVLGFNVQIDEAQSHGRTIWEYAPSSRGAQMLEAIAREIDVRGRPKRRAAAAAAGPGATRS
jgi:chromosome partitioning protein